MKGTSTLENQSRGNGVNRGPKSQFPKSIREVKGEDLMIGSVLNLGKKNPSPSLKLNVFIEYDPRTGEFVIDVVRNEAIKKLNEMLLGHADEKTINVDKIENLQLASVSDGNDYN